ncbi:MAG: AAA family ATPase [Acidimicrobiales bacterium]
MAGWEGDLEALKAMATDAIGGRGSLVVLSGAPGTGRTNLAGQLCTWAETKGMRPLWSRSVPGRGAPSLAPWADVVRAAVGATDPGFLLASLRGRVTAAHALGMAPELIPGRAPPDEPPLPDRLALFDGTTLLIDHLARAGPLLVVLDDFDAAGMASHRFLEFLLPALPDIPMLVVAIMSPDTPLLVRLSDHAHRLALPPLGAEVTAELDGRLARLTPATRRALALAAVVGEELDLDVLGVVDGAGEEEISVVLGEAQRAGIVDVSDAGTGRWAFTHTRWRQASAFGLTQAERPEAHLQVGRALEQRYGADAPAHAVELATHFLAAAAIDPDSAVRWAEQAGDHALRELAWEDAAVSYRQALDVGAAVGDDARARLLVAVGRALLAAGDDAGARSAYEDAADLARSRGRAGDLAGAALGLSSGLSGFEPSPADRAAVPLLEEALAALSGEPGPLPALVEARLSMALGGGAGVRRRRQELSDDAVDRARGLADGPTLAAALASRCDAYAGPGHHRLRLDGADEIVSLAVSAGDRETELLGRRLRIVSLLEGGLVESADTEISAFASITDRLGQPRFSWSVALWRGMRALLQGRFAECERRNAEATTLGRRAGISRVDTLGMVQFFNLRLSEDRVVEVEAAARSLAGRPDDRADSGATQACLLGLLGRDGEARGELARMAAERYAIATDHDDRWLAAMAVLAELAATLDQRPEATVIYDLLVPHAQRFAVEAMGSACHGSVSRHLGLLAHALGRWDDADAHFRQALAANEAAGAPLLVAHTRRQWSALLRASDVDDDWERGLDLLLGAEAIYRRLGVDRLADEARHLLARSHEPPASERAGADNAFRRQGDGWVLSYGGMEVRVAESLGMHDLAALLANPGRSFHVTDLVAGSFTGGVGQAGQRPRAAAGTAESVPPPDVDALARAEYVARLSELDAESAGSVPERSAGSVPERRAGSMPERSAGSVPERGAGSTLDPVRVSLALAERDFIADELAFASGGAKRSSAGDPVERARRAVATRIRLCLDRIDTAHPALGRHLRHSVRTGTFCSYEPEMPTNWPTGPGL